MPRFLSTHCRSCQCVKVIVNSLSCCSNARTKCIIIQRLHSFRNCTFISEILEFLISLYKLYADTNQHAIYSVQVGLTSLMRGMTFYCEAISAERIRGSLLRSTLCYAILLCDNTKPVKRPRYSFRTFPSHVDLDYCAL